MIGGKWADFNSKTALGEGPGFVDTFLDSRYIARKIMLIYGTG